MVLAFLGDSTMIRSCLPGPAPSARAGSGRLRAGAAPGAAAGVRAAFLRPVAGGPPASVGCFLRAGTGVSLVAVVLRGGLATITILNEARPSPILYLFDGCQARQGRAGPGRSPETEDR